MKKTRITYLIPADTIWFIDTGVDAGEGDLSIMNKVRGIRSEGGGYRERSWS